MQFEWDNIKEKANIKKHGISFREAQEALTCGTVVVLKEDPHHNEQRFVFMGMCKRLNVLVVVATYPDEEITRIVSARKANKMERKIYEAQL